MCPADDNKAAVQCLPVPHCRAPVKQHSRGMHSRHGITCMHCWVLAPLIDVHCCLRGPDCGTQLCVLLLIQVYGKGGHHRMGIFYGGHGQLLLCQVSWG